MSKNDPINITNNSNLNEKRNVLQFFLICIKMGECNSIECNFIQKTYHQKMRDVILNTAKDYYENDKEGLREQVRDKDRNLSEEEKNEKVEYGIEYGKNRYHNMSEEKKQKLKEYQKNYRDAKKT